MPTITGTEARAPLHTPGTHRLLVADTDGHRRVRAGSWVGRELARGAKVYYKGWLDEGARAEQHWIVGPSGAPGAPDAFASGQLEFLDFPSVIERCGGTTEGLFKLQTDEVERALDEGWPSVAMSQESPHRPMVDEDEAAELAAQERGYDLLADRWPLSTLCQLTIDEENAAANWETAAVHYREISDVHWSSSHHGGCWQLRGALDAHVARRFSAAVYGALDEARRSPSGPDLHIDLAAVEFMDFACAQILLLNARSAAREQKIVLHRAGDFLRHLIIAAGRPRSVLFSDEAGAR